MSYNCDWACGDKGNIGSTNGTQCSCCTERECNNWVVSLKIFSRYNVLDDGAFLKNKI